MKFSVLEDKVINKVWDSLSSNCIRPIFILFFQKTWTDTLYITKPYEQSYLVHQIWKIDKKIYFSICKQTVLASL